jgi:V8-like Glu-specific endopeptidase
MKKCLINASWRPFIGLLAVALAGCAASAPSATGPSHRDATLAGSSGCTSVTELAYAPSQASAAARYWTSARIKATPPVNGSTLGGLGTTRPPAGITPTSTTACLPATAASATATGATANAAITTHSGYPTVGKLTYLADGVLGLNCTATVINGTSAASNQDLILTAAHCIEGTLSGIPYTSTDFAFSPDWNNNTAPDGIWTVSKVFLNSGWMKCPVPIADCGTNPLDDYAILVLNRLHGRNIGNVTGAQAWSVNQPGTIGNVTIAGIPASSPNTLATVTGTTAATESGERYRTATTPGFTDGTSGGPWLENFNAKTGLGTLIGDTGGFEQGGPSNGSPSFSDIWNSAFASVVADAVKFEG